MCITLDDVSYLLHLPIKGELLNHGRIIKNEALKLMVDCLGVDLEAALRDME